MKTKDLIRIKKTAKSLKFNDLCELNRTIDISIIDVVEEICRSIHPKAEITVENEVVKVYARGGNNSVNIYSYKPLVNGKILRNDAKQNKVLYSI